MAWIESHQSLLNHPKTINLAAQLGKDRPTVIGHLHCLWWWSLDVVSVEGTFPARCTPAVIAQAAMWKGKPDKFLDALIDSGFIDFTDDDGFRLHDWDQYAGRLVETRRVRAEAGRAGGLKSGEARRSIASSNAVANVKQNEAPTNLTQPTNTTNQHNPTGLSAKMPFDASEISSLLSEFPGVNVNARWKEFVDWIEGGGARERPNNLYAAFQGFLKRPARRIGEEKAVYAVN